MPRPNALLLPCAGPRGGSSWVGSLPVDDDQEVFRRGDPKCRTAHSEIPAIRKSGPADRRTVQLQFAWCVSRKLLDRNKTCSWRRPPHGWAAVSPALLSDGCWLIGSAGIRRFFALAKCISSPRGVRCAAHAFRPKKGRLRSFQAHRASGQLGFRHVPPAMRERLETLQGSETCPAVPLDRQGDATPPIRWSGHGA